VRVTHLIDRHPSFAHLADEHSTSKAVVDDAPRGIGAPKCPDRESHGCTQYRPNTIPTCSGRSGHTEDVAANIIYGAGIPGDRELRLCGDIGDGTRAVELGVSAWANAVAFAVNGAKAIAVDPHPGRIEEVRQRAETSEVTVQCLQTDLADLGDITSGTCDVVVAVDTLTDVDDLSRVLRQVHRILKPSMPFVIALPHPYAEVSSERPYGTGRTVGDWFIACGRANFRVDQLLELGVTTTHPAPTTLILRARKEGS
jgi:SAM-dependent methyltransferase